MARFGTWVMGSILLGGLFGVSACSAEYEPNGGGEISGGEVSSVEEELTRLVPCASSDQCRPTEFCTTETGACNPPPGCRPGRPCPAVCYGVCRPRPPEKCGDVTCAPGLVCCNASCGICTRPGGICTQQVCEPEKECASDRDCRTFSDYCTGCDCRALANGEPDPVCPGPGVQCFVDPCFNQKAACVDGQCTLAGSQ